jgi:ribose transport system ATP-binding protein
MTGIGKQFGGNRVLQDVQLELRSGETHILAGENGAGKSTLVKILAGVHTEFEGRIEIEGTEVRPQSPLAAGALGIAVIHQELSLVGPMSVADNLFLGSPLSCGGFVHHARQCAEAAEHLRALGLELDVRRPVEQFAIGVQQMIEIAKALGRNARIIVMDEPTSALNAPEADRLFTLIHSLKQRRCGIIYISHKMEEIERIADRITVLRDGRWIGTAPAAELPPPKLIQWMIGQGIEGNQAHPQPAAVPPSPVAGARSGPDLQLNELLRLESFSVFPKGFSSSPAAENVSLSVRAGEIVGFGGLQGSGASELFMGLFGGYGTRTRGQVWLEGRPVQLISPKRAIANRVALLTNDRKATGLVLSESIAANATLADLRHLSPWGWRRPGRELEAARRMTAVLRLRAASLDMEAGALSGGNQQKVALAKWLQIGPKLLLLDEPTRGIDVGAKREIYQLMSEWTARGIAILLITSEMPELLMLSDRIVVLHRGSVSAEFLRKEATPERVLAAAMGNRSPRTQSNFQNE